MKEIWATKDTLGKWEGILERNRGWIEPQKVPRRRRYVLVKRHETPGVEATPPSPVAKRIDTPREVSCMYELQRALRIPIKLSKGFGLKTKCPHMDNERERSDSTSRP